MEVEEVETARLLLRPFSPAHLLALLDGAQPFEEQTGLAAADGLREFLMSEDVSPDWLIQLRESSAADPWVHGFAVIPRESRTVVGIAGFKGPPDDEGVAEIAYGIVPDYEGRGFATETAAALVAFARDSGRVRLIRAHTLPASNASTRVLIKCGFDRIAEVEDPEDGPLWRWELSRNST
jgi:RimJ/RimL family protein N-acetyltransferase